MMIYLRLGSGIGALQITVHPEDVQLHRGQPETDPGPLCRTQGDEVRTVLLPDVIATLPEIPRHHEEAGIDHRLINRPLAEESVPVHPGRIPTETDDPLPMTNDGRNVAGILHHRRKEINVEDLLRPLIPRGALRRHRTPLPL